MLPSLFDAEAVSLVLEYHLIVDQVVLQNQRYCLINDQVVLQTQRYCLFLGQVGPQQTEIGPDPGSGRKCTKAEKCVEFNWYSPVDGPDPRHGMSHRLRRRVTVGSQNVDH
ncbi:unnamed protein product [Arctogadus glacialis]